MAAYIGAQLDVNNTDWQQEYGPKAGALVQKRGGKSACGGWVHARAPRRQKQLPSVMCLLEFPSLEQAKAWDHDPAYAHMIHVRQTGADANIVILTESTSTL